jgi:hypothetical protein
MGVQVSNELEQERNLPWAIISGFDLSGREAKENLCQDEPLPFRNSNQ